MAESYLLDVPKNIPPSLNATRGAGGNWRNRHKAKKEWEGLLFVALIQAKVPRPLPGKVTAKAVLTVPTRTKRDEGNFRWLLEKALGDILQVQGHIPDDTPEHYVFPELSFAYEKGVSHTRITLEVGE